MKKLLALCLTVMLVVAMVPAVSAADAATINVSNVEATAGETVDVVVSLANNPGIISMRLEVSYNSDVLELTGKANGAAFVGMAYSQTLEANPYILNWVDSINPNNETDGTFATLTFKVKEGAAIGKSDITVTYNPEDVYNSDWANVGFEAVAGSVTVVCKEHVEKTVGAVEADCVNDGYTGDVVCDVCGAELVKGEKIAALGHTEELVNVKDHTAEEDGYTGDVVCTVCEEVIEAGDVIPAGHVWEEVAEEAATCTEDGVKAHFGCSLCAEIAADAEGAEVKAEDLVIKATGHTYVDGVCACGEKEAVEEKPEVKPEVKPENTDKGDKAPATNDMANIYVVFAMLVAAAFASVVVLKKKA